MRIKNFTIKNYRSFNKEQVFNFIDNDGSLSLMYGPNGSGKSNFFKALHFFCDFIKNSTHFVANPDSFYEPFLLNEDGKDNPSEFSITIITEGEIEYKYFFSLFNGNVENEWLSQKKKNEDSFNTIFRRKSMRNDEYAEKGFSRALLNSTRSNSLVMTRAYEVNNNTAVDFVKNINMIIFISSQVPMDGGVVSTSEKVLESEDSKQKILNFLKESDLFIRDLSVIKNRMPDEIFNKLPFNDEFKSNFNRVGYTVSTSHYVRNKDGKVIGIKNFDLTHNESDGTQRIFELAAPLLSTLENGYTLFIDDFDARLHPKECEFIVNLFNKKNNKNGAYLVANTHCTYLMDVVNRKNLYLFGKNNYEETEIATISSGARDVAIQKKYNMGAFGAVPRVAEYGH